MGPPECFHWQLVAQVEAAVARDVFQVRGVALCWLRSWLVLFRAESMRAESMV